MESLFHLSLQGSHNEDCSESHGVDARRGDDGSGAVGGVQQDRADQEPGAGRDQHQGHQGRHEEDGGAVEEDRDRDREKGHGCEDRDQDQKHEGCNPGDTGAQGHDEGRHEDGEHQEDGFLEEAPALTLWRYRIAGEAPAAMCAFPHLAGDQPQRGADHPSGKRANEDGNFEIQQRVAGGLPLHPLHQR